MNRRTILRATAAATALAVAGCTTQSDSSTAPDGVTPTADLPQTTTGAPFIRVDFSDNDAWSTIKDDVAKSGGKPQLEYLDDRSLSDLSGEELTKRFPAVFPDQFDRPIVFIADATAMQGPAYPILVIDLHTTDNHAPFRTIPAEVAAIEINLREANKDFADYANALSADGIYRG